MVLAHALKIVVSARGLKCVSCILGLQMWYVSYSLLGVDSQNIGISTDKFGSNTFSWICSLRVISTLQIGHTRKGNNELCIKLFYYYGYTTLTVTEFTIHARRTFVQKEHKLMGVSASATLISSVSTAATRLKQPKTITTPDAKLGHFRPAFFLIVAM